ncbi:unnamed protein product, partial [marine sediment metagenome]
RNTFIITKDEVEVHRNLGDLDEAMLQFELAQL